MHAHCFAFNVTWDEKEQRFKAGQFRELKRDAPYFQAAFRVRLAGKLQDLGFGIVRKRDDFELAGVPAHLLKRFSRRTEEIERVAAEKGITDTAVLNAMMRVPRHFFLDKAFLEQAYSDHAFRIGAGQTISQPYTVAYQTSLLGIQPGEKILEIGTGSAYQACVLGEMGAQVFTIERQKPLFDAVKKFTFKTFTIII